MIRTNYSILVLVASFAGAAQAISVVGAGNIAGSIAQGIAQHVMEDKLVNAGDTVAANVDTIVPEVQTRIKEQLSHLRNEATVVPEVEDIVEDIVENVEGIVSANLAIIVPEAEDIVENAEESFPADTTAVVPEVQTRFEDELSHLRHDATNAVTSAAAGISGSKIDSIIIQGEENVEDEEEKVLSPLLTGDHSGIVYDRSFDYVNPSVKGFGIFFDDSTCEEQDKFGDRKCEFNWGDNFAVRVEGELEEDLIEGDKITAKLRINRVLKWEFTCNVCGEDCEVTVPLLDKAITFKTQPCPIAKDLSRTMDLILPESGIGIHVGVTGKIQLVSANNDDIITVIPDIDID